MTRLITAVVFVIAAISVAAQTTAPASSAATAIIRGRVVGADGRPVKQVVVRVLGATARMQRGSLTDENGRFELKDLVADTYTTSINRSGYFAIDPVRRRTIPGKRVTIGDGEVLERVEIVVARTSAIEGRVTDEDGEPIEGADVQPMQVRFVNGHRQLMEGARSRRTNDLGQFRLYGVEPGEHVIVVQPPTTGTNRLPRYPLTYFPGTPTLGEAQVVTVSIGHDTQNVDVRLSPRRAARISGIGAQSRRTAAHRWTRAGEQPAFGRSRGSSAHIPDAG